MSDEKMPPLGHVFGNEDRVKVAKTKVAPFAYICYLETYMEGETKVSGRGTGFLISPTCIVTCGHVLYRRDAPQKNKWVARVDIAPAFDGRNAPFGSRNVPATQNSLVVIKSFIDSNKPAIWRQNDIGAIILPRRLAFEISGNMIGLAEMSSGIQGREFMIPGYSGDKNGEMWAAKGKVIERDQDFLRHEIDVTEGASGAPLLALKQDGTPGNVAYGIHSAELKVPQKANAAIAFTAANQATIMDWAGKVNPD
ncbi:MAG TPA: trypsin-like peptidase domain-containing protein [Allosphingosinicella sp.]